MLISSILFSPGFVIDSLQFNMMFSYVFANISRVSPGVSSVSPQCFSHFYFRFSELHNLSAILGIIFFVTFHHQLIEVQIFIASNFSPGDTSFFSTLVLYACFDLQHNLVFVIFNCFS